MSRFDDYVRDIPMEIGAKFYPRAEILLPPCAVPRLPDLSSKHDFKVELRAREAYDTRNQAKEEVVTKTTTAAAEATPTLAPSTSTSSLPSVLEVLQPSRPEPSAANVTTVAEPSKIVSFEEFESKGNVFDELEWRSIDNRKALIQILGGASSVSEPTTPNPAPQPQPPTTPGIVLPSYPSLNFPSKPAKSNGVSINGKDSTVSYSKASENTPPSSVAKTTATSSSQSTKISLRQRLLTKGYRENLVNSALAKVPNERIVHIEYYMKGMSILEKKGVNVDSSLCFLLESGVTNKQLVLQRAQTADQMLSMGFDSDKVFKSLISTNGDRLKALELVLQS